jgi:hypothetical protein
MYVAAVADHPGAAPGIETETRVVDELRARAMSPLLASLPEVIAPITLDARPAVVLTTTGGLRVGVSSTPPVEVVFEAMWPWLDALWRDTGGVVEPVELGAAAADQLLARCCGSRRLGPTLGAVHRARHRLGRHRASRTAVHGCLCDRHVRFDAEGVAGVDDWGVATLNGEPLRDLGGFAARHAAGRLPEVVADRTGFAHLIRDFVVAGLTAAGLPGERWRDVLLLAQVERAVVGLERGQVDQMGLLAASVQELPREHTESEAAI